MSEFDEEKHIEKIISSYAARAVMREKSAEEYKQPDWRRQGVVLSCGRRRALERRGNSESPPSRAERRHANRRHKAASEPADGASWRILVVALKDRGGAAFNPKPGDEVFVEHAHPESGKGCRKPAVAGAEQSQVPNAPARDDNRDYVVHLSGKPPGDK
jgi:hypothetical protein